jgi:hypothetical protein
MAASGGGGQRPSSGSWLLPNDQDAAGAQYASGDLHERSTSDDPQRG